MSIVAESNLRIAAAQRRMQARQANLRADLLALKSSWGATLTQPWVVGGALVGGLMLSRRSRATPAPVECRCKSQGPSLLRSVGTALLVPMISQWMDAARKHPEGVATAERPDRT
jgi:hypothetical protein